MATTLLSAISHDSDPIALSGDPLDPGAVAVQVDSEELGIVRGVDSPLFVLRGWNGTAPTSHDAGATVTPLYRKLSTTPGGA